MSQRAAGGLPSAPLMGLPCGCPRGLNLACKQAGCLSRECPGVFPSTVFIPRVHSRSTASCLPSAIPCQRSGLVPSSWSCTTSTACSALELRACCIPLPVMRFAAFQVFARQRPGGPWLPSPCGEGPTCRPKATRPRARRLSAVCPSPVHPAPSSTRHRTDSRAAIAGDAPRCPPSTEVVDVSEGRRPAPGPTRRSCQGLPVAGFVGVRRLSRPARGAIPTALTPFGAFPSSTAVLASVRSSGSPHTRRC